jgi:hypothetical protein
MKQKQDIDWVKALADLQAAKKRKQGIPPWLWGILTLLVLVGLMCVGKTAPKTEPKKESPPAWAVAGQNAAIGQKVTFTADTWGYSSLDLLLAARRAARRHAETFAQHNRDAFAAGQAVTMSQGEECKVVDKVTSGDDVYLRVRRVPGGTRAWWVLATEVE